MNLRKKQRPVDILSMVKDNLPRAVGDLLDPNGNYSLDYLEVGNAHYLLFGKKKCLY